MATVEEVKECLLEACPGADVSGVSESDQVHRITGEVRWAGFEGMLVQDRWGHIARNVRDRLGARGLNIGVLYLLTPTEKLDD
jgi:hypothetical protein